MSIWFSGLDEVIGGKNVTKYYRHEITSGTSGTVSAITGVSPIADDDPNSAGCLVAKVGTGGNLQPTYSATGTYIRATIDANGNYVLCDGAGTPTAPISFPVTLIYQGAIKFRNFVSTTAFTALLDYTGDHGSLGGLSDDDHPQYLLADGTRALSADWDAGSFEIRAQTFESDVATGTSPFTIASTTLVSNLNADLLDGYHYSSFEPANANIQSHIGTITGNPHAVTKSDVGLGSVENTALSTWAGTTNITTLGTISTGSFPYANLTGVPLTSGTAQGQMPFWDATLSKLAYTETSESFWDDTNKSLGIGTATPTGILTINTTIAGQKTLYDFTYGVIGLGGVYKDSSNNIYLAFNKADTTNTIALRTSGTSYFNGGVVGINTTTPRRKLDILDATNPQLRLTHTDNSIYTDMRCDASGNMTFTTTGDFFRFSGDPMDFINDNTTAYPGVWSGGTDHYTAQSYDTVRVRNTDTTGDFASLFFQNQAASLGFGAGRICLVKTDAYDAAFTFSLRSGTQMIERMRLSDVGALLPQASGQDIGSSSLRWDVFAETLDWSNAAAKPKIYTQSTEPDIPNDTMAFWKDSDDSKYYLILDIGGTQKKLELT